MASRDSFAAARSHMSKTDMTNVSKEASLCWIGHWLIDFPSKVGSPSKPCLVLRDSIHIAADWPRRHCDLLSFVFLEIRNDLW